MAELLVLDLDGTIVVNSEVSAATGDYLANYLAEDGNYLFLNSGGALSRSKVVAKWIAKRCQNEDEAYKKIFYNGYNGIAVYQGDELVATHYLPVKRLLNSLAHRDYFFSYALFYNVDGEEITNYIYDGRPVENDVDNVAFIQLNALMLDSGQVQIGHENYFFIDDGQTTTVLWDGKLVVTKEIQARLGLADKEIIVYGDGYNDVRMIRHFQGTKMANSSDWLADVEVSETLYSAEEDGVIKHLKTRKHPLVLDVIEETAVPNLSPDKKTNDEKNVVWMFGEANVIEINKKSPDLPQFAAGGKRHFYHYYVTKNEAWAKKWQAEFPDLKIVYAKYGLQEKPKTKRKFWFS